MKRNTFIWYMMIPILMGATSFSCKRNHQRQDDGIKVIKIDVKDKGIGNPIEIEKIIPLETNKDCLVGYIKKLVFWNNKILVIDEDSKTFFLFDESGKLIFKTIEGKGPGEVLAPTIFNIDRRDTTILVYQQMLRKFSRYDFTGKIIDTKTITNQNKLIIKDFYPVGRDTFLIFHYNVSNPGKDEPRQITWSLLTGELSYVKQFDITLNKNKEPYYVTQPAAVASNQVLFVVPWSYNIYSLTGTDYRIKYVIDFGNAAIPSEQREIQSARDLYRIMIESKKIGCLVSVMIEKDLLVVDADHGDGSQVFLHSLTKGRTICINNYIQRGLLPKCRIWGLTGNGSMYAIVEPEDFIDFNRLHQGFSNLEITINSNPILISFQINDIF